MDRHIELLRRHIKDQAAEVEQLAVTWEQQKESDQERLSKQQSTSEQLQIDVANAESTDLAGETASMGFSNQQKAATFAKLVEHAATIRALRNELKHQKDAAEKGNAVAPGEMEAAIPAIGHRDQQIEDLRRAKDEADGKLSTQSKFFITYIETAHSVTGLEVSVIDDMMSIHELAMASITALPIEGIARPGPQVTILGAVPRRNSASGFFSALSLWLSTRGGSTEIHGIDQFYDGQVVVDNQNVIPWIASTASQAIRNLSPQHTATPNVKLIMLMVQGIAYIHQAAKVVPLNESPSDLLELLDTWLDGQETPTNSLLKHAVAAVQQLVQQDVQIDSWISPNKLHSAQVLGAWNSELSADTILIADELDGAFLLLESSGDVTLFAKNDSKFYHVRNDAMRYCLEVGEKIPRLELTNSLSSTDTGHALDWLTAYVW